MASDRADEENYQIQIENLRKMRAMFQAIKEATEKIHDDIYQVHKINNPTILEEAKALKDTIEKLD